MVLSTTASAQGADECVNADVLAPGTSAVLVDSNLCSDTGVPATTSATSSCLLSNDVWFQWVAPRTGMTTFSTCVTDWDTEIGIYEGADCATMVGLGCNDDNNALGCSGVSSSISVPVTAGETYHIQVGYWSTSGAEWGETTLFIDEDLPALAGGDECATADDIGAGDVVVPFDTNLASDTQAPATSSTHSGPFTMSNDIWFRWTATQSGSVTFATCGAALDTEIAVWAGTDCAALTFLNSNDDSCGLQSEVTVPAFRGVTYFVQVGYWSGSGSTWGTGDLTITETPLADNIGTNYCWTNANSSGYPAEISAIGSALVSDNDMTLVATSLPAGEFGYFVASPPMPSGGPIAVSGSSGNLCIGSNTSRFVNQIGQASPIGVFSVAVDLNAFPSNPAIAVMPGETYNFICWFRDGMGSNFTNGVSVDFL